MSSPYPSWLQSLVTRRLCVIWLVCCSVTFKTVQNKNSHILDHDVLVWHQAIDTIVPSLPPVFWRPLVQQQRGALLEGQLPGRSADVVKLGDGFDGLTLCRERWSGESDSEISDICNHSWCIQTDIPSVCVLSLYVVACVHVVSWAAQIFQLWSIVIQLDNSRPGPQQALRSFSRLIIASDERRSIWLSRVSHCQAGSDLISSISNYSKALTWERLM